MKNSTVYAFSCFLLIAMAMLMVWDLGLWAWGGMFTALYSGACYGWHREELRKEKEGYSDKEKVQS